MMKIFFNTFTILIIVVLLNLFAQTGWQWQNPLPQGNTLYCIRMINASTCFAAVDYGTILKSTNRGINWNIQNSGVNVMLRGLWFINLNT